MSTTPTAPDSECSQLMEVGTVQLKRNIFPVHRSVDQWCTDSSNSVIADLKNKASNKKHPLHDSVVGKKHLINLRSDKNRGTHSR